MPTRTICTCHRYGEHALASLAAHDTRYPYFLYLPWQAVHSPHEAPAAWPHQKDDAEVYRGMLWAADVCVGTAATPQKCAREQRA